MAVQSTVVLIEETNELTKRKELAAVRVTRKLKIKPERFRFKAAGRSMGQQELEGG